MSSAAVTAESGEVQGFTQRLLGGIEKVGNKVPHPVLIFLYLIALVFALSVILDLLNVGITEEIIVPTSPPVADLDDLPAGSTALPVVVEPTYSDDFTIERVRVEIKSLLSIDGLRFFFTSFVNNFAGFSVVSVIFVAMIGVGVAEEAGLMGALIRKLVQVAPARALTFIIILIGGLSSVATDAGYLILIPLAGAAFLTVKRHPLAGIAAAYAGVSAAFSVNVLIAPLDALLTEMTNEAMQVAQPGESITITANLYFSIASTIVMAVIMTIITEKIIEPSLGVFQPSSSPGADGDIGEQPAEAIVDPAAESRGLRYTLFGLIGAIIVIALLAVPSGAPLRDPNNGDLIGNTPFMGSLIFLISLIFLVCGICYGIGAQTLKSSVDVINWVTKTFASLSGLIFMLLIISQFIAYFNFSNMPNVIAGGMAHLLERADVNEVLLLIGFILVICLLDIIIPGSLPKWAIFAPIFVPIFVNLGVSPQTVLAAYRIGDSPMNVITPLMVYLPFIVIVAQRYDKSTGIGTIISLMIPYTLILLVLWIVFFVLWYLVGIPLGPGYPVGL
ncbi:MAG TPA: AbgT family transporter [Thermomicrobiales bacterium]